MTSELITSHIFLQLLPSSNFFLHKGTSLRLMDSSEAPANQQMNESVFLCRINRSMTHSPFRIQEKAVSNYGIRVGILTSFLCIMLNNLIMREFSHRNIDLMTYFIERTTSVKITFWWFSHVLVSFF